METVKTPGLAGFTRVVILTAIYFVGGLIGQESSIMEDKGSYIVLVWPPAGIAMAAILLFGYRFWPGVAAGAVLFSFMRGMPLGFFTLGTAIGNTIGAVVCVFLLDRFIQFRNSLERLRDAAGFIVLACLIGTTVNAAFNVVGLVYANEIKYDDLFPNVLTWWVPNAMAGLVVAPFILAWGTPSHNRWSFKLIAEAVLCACFLVAGTVISFNTYLSNGYYVLAYLPYPFLVWGALRFGIRGATTGTLLVSALAIYSLLQGSGPFVTDVPRTNVMLVGCYIGIVAVSNLLLAAIAVERERAEQAVAESEKRYRAVVEDQTELISRFKPDGTLTFVNEAFCRFYDQNSETLLSTTSPIASPENRQLHQHHMEGLTADKPVASYDYELRRPDGRMVWHQCTLHQLFDRWGHPHEVQIVEQDITQRKQAEDALRKSEEMFQLISGNVDDLIAVTSADGKCLYNSPSYKKILGDPERLIGTDYFDPIHPEDREKVKAAFHDTIEKGAGQRMEYRYLLPGNNVRYIEAVSNYVPGDAAQMGKVVSVARDITERKQIEEDLAKARDAALVAARQKAEFLANMSHEIRTPLNGVIGLTSLLLHTELSKQQEEYAENIRTCSDSLLTIINDILDFSKIEAGKLTLEILDFSLHEAVESSLALLAERAQAKNLELVGFVTPDAATLIRGDLGRLRQIIVNLLSNAVKFTQQGEVVLTVSQVSATHTQTLLRFEVKDTGIGIPKEAQGNLFRSFSQADGSTTRKFGGTGLGLAICKELVTLMHGQIGLESTPGKGSIFWFTIPFETQSIAAEKRIDFNIRVLIVDDNATHRQLLEQLLKVWKMNPDGASSGPEALGKLRQSVLEGRPYQMAILDMNMPMMDGLALARAIKADPSTASIRLVLLTALGQSLEAATIQEAGISDSLAKPIKQSQLYNCLLEVMGQTPKPVVEPIKRVKADSDTTIRRKEKNLRILLAEDNSINQMVALGQLKDLGYSADAVSNGLEVIEVIKRIPYDIILMDCQMPEMDGYEATRSIRRHEHELTASGQLKTPVTIIAMTAHAMQGDREKCIEAGMNDYMSKPIEEEELKTVLHRWTPIATPAPSPSPAPSAQASLTPGSLPANQTQQGGQPETPPEPETPPVEMKRLLRITSGESGKLRELVGLYFDQADELLGGLESAIKTGDAKKVEQLAHKCCGASASCGMNSIVPSLRELERLGREGKLAGTELVFGQAKIELNRIREFLDNYMKTSLNTGHQPLL